MHVDLVWHDDDERILRWQFSAPVGVLDYTIPMNDTATRCVLSDHAAVDVIIDMGWRMPFPNRHFKYLRQAILSAPPTMRRVVIVVANPFSRVVMHMGLLRPYPELRERGVTTATTIEQALQQLST